MTFSILARDESGAFGSAIASSSPAVAARCVTLVDSVGGANSQNITDPRLGPKILRQIESGLPSSEAIARIVADDTTSEYRQLLAIDDLGRTGVHSGDRSLGVYASAHGPSVVAAGNMLRSAVVPQAMVDAYLAAEGDLELRLLAALRGALATGGEEGPIHSAGLSVVRGAGWRVTDLRIDWHDEPVEALSELLDVWLPQRDDYVTRALAPHTAPSYGVPGNE